LIDLAQHLRLIDQCCYKRKKAAEHKLLKEKK